MKLRLVPASTGAQWVRQGFAIFFKQPLGFALLFASFLFALFVSMLLPLLGGLLLLALLPLVSLGFMIGTREALAGRFPLPRVFIAPLRGGRQRWVALLQLGVLYALATALVMWASDVLDGGALDRAMQAVARNNGAPEAMAEQFADGQLQFGLLLRFGLLGLLSVPFWHAPALVHWGGHTAGKSMFFSLMACWRNRGAFAVYGLAWFAAVVAFTVVANLLAVLLGNVGWLAMTAMPTTLVLSTIFYASLYFTFADCFDMEAAESAGTADPSTSGDH